MEKPIVVEQSGQGAESTRGPCSSTMAMGLSPPMTIEPIRPLAGLYFQYVLAGAGDFHEPSEADRGESLGQLEHQVATVFGHLPITGSDQAIAGPDRSGVVRHAAANEHFQWVDGGGIVMNNLDESRGVPVAQFHQSSESRGGGDAVFQQHAIECNGADGAEPDAVFGNRQFA